MGPSLRKSVAEVWDANILSLTDSRLGRTNEGLASGKRLHNYGKIHHVQWVNPLFLWATVKLAM